ncbi:MAG: rRNA maturation RNase YbeY [Clostridia bacterium]|nr:rRNA maturation RNase YbeY [Clostridia bacterium]
MIRFSGASFKEKSLIKKVEKACFKHLGQDNFFMIDLTVVDEETIHELNKEARGVDRVTDVLSFPSFERLSLPVSYDGFHVKDMDGKRVFLGSIMICRKRAEEQAAEYGHSFERELGFLACHGFLHILGFDHIEPDDEKIMIGHQKAVMDMVGLKRQ